MKYKKYLNDIDLNYKDDKTENLEIIEDITLKPQFIPSSYYNEALKQLSFWTFGLMLDKKKEKPVNKAKIFLI